ncbi:MAG: CBS domain-containing protein [Thaumarchaeota archaeon]|nr:MAG: CBS domain-containing protein [Nitrososphaerota archaeon]TLX91497.1 MAG: CBS domain-containing protein [Nitrososphaerota archaeon]
MNDRVQDIMTKKVISIDEGIMANEAAKIMTEKRISSLIVERENVPIGIITEKDFVKKICTKDLVSSKIKVGTIMSKIQTYASPDTPVEVAVQRMVNHKIRRLPILSEGKVVGIITVTDLARQLRTILLVDGILSEENEV